LVNVAKLFDNAVVRDGLADEGVGVRHGAAILGCVLNQVNEPLTGILFLRQRTSAITSAILDFCVAAQA
jgi:hypothetical protein